MKMRTCWKCWRRRPLRKIATRLDGIEGRCVDRVGCASEETRLAGKWVRRDRGFHDRADREVSWGQWHK